MKVITAPETYVRERNDISCFLAGGISGCPNWQEEVIRILKSQDFNEGLDNLVIFNPRREVYTPGLNASYDQISWEFDCLSEMDIFSMYFRKETIQPICLYELGRYLSEMRHRFPYDYWKRIIISVDPKYERVDDVIIQTNLALEPANLKIRIFESSAVDHAVQIIKAYHYIWEERNDET